MVKVQTKSIQEITSGSVPNASIGEQNLFIDSSDNLLKTKNSGGIVTQIIGSVVKMYNHNGGTVTGTVAETTIATITIAADTFKNNFNIKADSVFTSDESQGTTSRLKINAATVKTSYGANLSTVSSSIEGNIAGITFVESGLDCTIENVIIITLENNNSTSGRDVTCDGFTIIASD